MAKNKINGSRRRSQTHADPVFDYRRISETVAGLNVGFEQALGHLADLRQFDGFPGIPGCFFKICTITLEEVRAWANFEIAEAIRDRAEGDWTRFGRRRRQWEKKTWDPNDVLIEAEEVKKKRQQAEKKRSTRP